MTGWIVAILLLSGLIGLHLGWWRRYRSLALGQTAKPAGLTDALGVTDMFENMAEGVLATNQKGIIEFANPSFCKLFELADDPKGRTVMEAIRIHEVYELVNLLKQDNQVVQEDLVFVDGDSWNHLICRCTRLCQAEAVPSKAMMALIMSILRIWVRPYWPMKILERDRESGLLAEEAQVFLQRSAVVCQPKGVGAHVKMCEKHND